MGLPGVLLVDSDDRLHRMCATAARIHGFDADVVTTAAAGFERMAHGSYSVVVADLEQPGVAGRSFLEELCDRYPGITIVALVRGSAIDVPRSHELDTAIATVVGTPVESEIFGAALHDALDHHHRRVRRKLDAVDHSTILLVEDSDGDALLVVEYLSEICGARVTRATRVEDAAQILRGVSYDFVITDLTLPDACGLDAVRRLQPLAPNAPFIVLTGIDDEDIAIRAMQQGAQDYLVKGQLDAPTLRRTLRHAAERKRVYNRLVHLSRHDPLTGVGNRAALRDRIETTLARARRRELGFAVLFIDLDRFKAINDDLGHDAGDAVLIEISARICACVRTSDMVARLGGDEFAVLLDELQPTDHPLDVGRRILRSIERPIMLQGGEVVVTASIGVARYPDAAGSVDDILKAADTAMYAAKRSGRNNIQIVGEVAAEDRDRVSLTHGLQHALERGELSLHFQPQLTLDRHRVVGYEALLRWYRPGGVMVPPAEFIPLLEDSGRIVAVGEWVLARACEQLAIWRASGYRDIRVAVNVSARQFEGTGLIDTVGDCLRRYDLPPPCLELELTETVLMGDTSHVKGILDVLRRLGVRIAIDDFGTGYSSLAYLSRFAVDCLKIDRSFIDQVHVDRERALITSAIITLGHHLGLEVVAEGVELAEQLAFVTSARCDLAQGYLLGRPARAEHVTAALCS